jgi:sugar lactone lactonase YvrE
MKQYDVQVVYDVPTQVGECPLWHADEQALYYIDIAGQAVHGHRIGNGNGNHRVWHLSSEPGCIALCESGGLVVAMRSGIALLNTDDGSLTPLLDAPYDSAKIRFNDGRCDSAGRLWVGTLYEPRDRPGGTLYCLERGILRDVGLAVTTSNGVAFSRDSRTLYHADTRAHRLMAYDYDPGTAHIGAGHLVHQFSSDRSQNYGGRPDGAAIDSEGAYWCAMFEGGRILRLSPDGDILLEIPVPVRCPTMIAFGGVDMRTLYITSARQNRSDDELLRYPLSGCVLSMRVDIAGCSEFAYKT